MPLGVKPMPQSLALACAPSSSQPRLLSSISSNVHSAPPPSEQLLMTMLCIAPATEPLHEEDGNRASWLVGLNPNIVDRHLDRLRINACTILEPVIVTKAQLLAGGRSPDARKFGRIAAP